MSDTIRLIIDTDPGQDDAAAILMAHALAKRGLIDFMALTAVAGNVGIKLTERNARIICDWPNQKEFPVYAGAARPLLREPVTAEELASFIAYWQAEGKVFHHVQWQQKLARSLQIGRASNGGLPKRDVNTVSEPDSQIPPGFRG